MTPAPTFRLNNGVDMPALGLGVFNNDQPELTQPAIETALANGYRLIDTAAAYGNEADVGAGIRASGLPRQDIFVITKLWMSHYGDAARRGFDSSLRRLGVDHIDLYLLHWPSPVDFEATLAAYRTAETLLAEGRVRAIGVANFEIPHLQHLLTETSVTPAVNQIELHPGFTNARLAAANAELGILTQSWSPLGGSTRRAGEPASDPLASSKVATIAARHDRTPGQIILRWHYQKGYCAIPKSVHASRIAQNIQIFDFSLSLEEIAVIDDLDTGRRSGPDPHTVSMATIPRIIED